MLVIVEVDDQGTLIEESFNDIYSLLAEECPELAFTAHPSESWLLISDVLEWLSAAAWQTGDAIDTHELVRLWHRYNDHGDMDVKALDALVR